MITTPATITALGSITVRAPPAASSHQPGALVVASGARVIIGGVAVEDSSGGRSPAPRRPSRPPTRGRAWTSFVADEGGRGRVVRALHEAANPNHRLRVEHDAHTLLIHLSDEDGGGWTTIAIDRATRRWAVAQRRRQGDSAREAFERLYGP